MAEIHLQGVIFSGTNEGAHFVGLDWVRRGVQHLVGFAPYPGTLNVRLLDPDAANRWRPIRERAGVRLTPPEPDGCGARLIVVLVNDRCPAAVVVPDVTRYPDDVLEVIAPVHLRTLLGVGDGDKVSLTVQVG